MMFGRLRVEMRSSTCLTDWIKVVSEEGERTGSCRIHRTLAMREKLGIQIWKQLKSPRRNFSFRGQHRLIQE